MSIHVLGKEKSCQLANVFWKQSVHSTVRGSVDMNGLTSWKTAGEPEKSHDDRRAALLQAGVTSRQ